MQFSAARAGNQMLYMLESILIMLVATKAYNLVHTYCGSPVTAACTSGGEKKQKKKQRTKKPGRNVTEHY